MEKEYSDDPDQINDSISQISDLTGLSYATGASRASALSKASGISKASGYSISSSASQPMRLDFDRIIDEFLGSHSRVGKRGKKVARLGPQTWMEQLDEVRRGLSPARVGARTAARSKG